MYMYAYTLEHAKERARTKGTKRHTVRNHSYQALYAAGGSIRDEWVRDATTVLSSTSMYDIRRVDCLGDRSDASRLASFVHCLSLLHDVGMLQQCMRCSAAELADTLLHNVASMPVGVSPMAVQLASSVLALALELTHDSGSNTRSGATTTATALGESLLEVLLDETVVTAQV